MIRIFIGLDERQPIAAQVLIHSLYSRSSVPLSITPLVLSQLPIKRKGLTSFTFSRYTVPWLCEFRGRAIFMDADMLCLTDIAKLMDEADPLAAISVVKNERRFEWPSLMVFNCAACLKLQPDWIDSKETNPAALTWAKQIGELPSEYNHLVGYDRQRKDAKIVHFTQGVPCWQETMDCEYATEWHAERKSANSSVSWKELMGGSIHREKVLGA